MGTRGSFGVRIDGKDKLTYNHYDSYPDGLGDSIVTQIKDMLFLDVFADYKEKLEEFKKQARDLVLVDTHVKPTEEQKANLSKYADLTVSDRSLDDWYCLLRKLQGNLQETLKAGYMSEGNDFIHDSLFCEWAYIVNLDTETFEVYKGFQEHPHNKGRYAAKSKRERDSGYFGCALIAEYPLMAITENWMKSINEEEEE